MRIVFLVKRFLPATGGVERYVAELARAVTARGHRVTVVAGAHDSDLPEREKFDQVEVCRFPALRSPARCAWALSRIVPVFQQADVVHLCDTEMHDYFWRMLGWRVMPRRLFLTLHGMSCVYPVPQRERERARRARRLVDGMIHDGAFIGQWLNVDPDLIAPQGLRPTAREIAARPEPAEPSAIYIGRLEPDTGVALYLDALTVLRDRWNVSLPLHVYGDGSLQRALRSQANAQELRVTFCGNAPDAQERVGDHTLAFVSGRMTIHESLARRRPVVAAFCNPIRADYVRGEAFSPHIATGGSGVEIAEHAHRLLSDEAVRRDVAERGWRHVSELSWDRTADAYLNVWTTRAPAPTRPVAWRHRTRLAWRMWREAASAEQSRDHIVSDADRIGRMKEDTVGADRNQTTSSITHCEDNLVCGTGE